MRILSIDGGGIRGIIPGMVLVALEKKLQQLKGDQNFRLADAFDMIAGTSTGGILACLYLCPDPNNQRRPKFSAQDAVDLYLQNGDDIFDVSIFKKIESIGGLTDEKYSADTREKVLKDYMGDLKLSQLLRPCLIPAYDITERRAYFFNQRDTDGGTDLSSDFLVRDIARSTSAAPTYFEPAHVSAMNRAVHAFVDGGVFANNPAMCACVEAFGYDAELKVTDLKVLSLGTGAVDQPYSYTDSRNWGKIGWVGPILDIMFSGVSETVDYQLRTLFRSVACSEQYLRLQVDLKKCPNVDGAMDNASEKNMRALESVGSALVSDNDAALSAFARLL